MQTWHGLGKYETLTAMLKITGDNKKMAVFATYITNLYGYRLKKISSSEDKKRLRAEYANRMLSKLNIEIKVINKDKIPDDGQYLLASNHRTIIDPTIIEVALENKKLFGHWISKKELYDSFFFGLFVRNAGTILLDREKSQMGGFFKDIKVAVKDADSIFIFPEGTRNKSDEVLSEFKDGSQLIAMKNRIDILPVYIRDRADNILADAIKDSSIKRVIEVEFGDLISYKDRKIPLQETYKNRFNIK